MKIVDGLKLTFETVRRVEGVGCKTATLLYLAYRHMLRLLGVRKPYAPPITCVYKMPYGQFKIRRGTNDLQILRAEREIWDEFMVDGDVFIDAGAHIGKYSIMLRHRFKRIIAVEANPETFKVLVENIRLNKADNVKAVNRALWYKDNEYLEFFLTKRNTGASSLNLEHIIEEGFIVKQKIPIRAITLNSLLEQENIKDVDLVKLDMEGSEYEVLLGLDLDKHVVRKIIYEAWNREYSNKISSYLRRFGYEVHPTRHPEYWVAEKIQDI